MFRFGTLPKNDESESLMIITCPDCSTRYNVADDSIGPKGRNVRCSNCNNTWFVSSDPEVMALHENKIDVIEALPDDTPSNDYEKAEHDFHETDGYRSDPAKGAHVEFRDKVDRERRNRRLASVSMIWVVTLGILLFAAILVFTMRQTIVDRFPATASIYQAFGINVKKSGLDFESPATRNLMLEGKPVLVVNGAVINRSNEAQHVPMIKLSIFDKSGDIITEWMVEPSKSRLDPEERLEYTSQLPDPPVDADGLKYEFTDDFASLETAESKK